MASPSPLASPRRRGDNDGKTLEHSSSTLSESDRVVSSQSQSSVKRKFPKHLVEIYDIEGLLGSGAFSTVFRCVHRATGQVRAVKKIDTSSLSPRDIAHEIALMKLLRHQNVVRCYDVFLEAQFVNIVVDIFTGGDLVDGLNAHRKARGRIPDAQLALLTRQMVAEPSFGMSKACRDFVAACLTKDPRLRPPALEAQRHAWMKTPAPGGIGHPTAASRARECAGTLASCFGGICAGICRCGWEVCLEILAQHPTEKQPSSSGRDVQATADDNAETAEATQSPVRQPGM